MSGAGRGKPGPKPLPSEELAARERAQRQRQYALNKIDGLSPEELRLFEGRFTSETVALDSRGSLRAGSRIGEGCRWIRGRSSH